MWGTDVIESNAWSTWSLLQDSQADKNLETAPSEYSSLSPLVLWRNQTTKQSITNMAGSGLVVVYFLMQSPHTEPTETPKTLALSSQPVMGQKWDLGVGISNSTSVSIWTEVPILYINRRPGLPCRGRKGKTTRNWWINDTYFYECTGPWYNEILCCDLRVICKRRGKT